MVSFGIGQAVRRVEDHRFLTGTGAFVGDMILPRQCYGAPVLSPHAHARITRIDTAAAAAAPGVLAVLTGADAAADKIGGIPPYFMPEAWGGPEGLCDGAAGAAGRARALRRRPRRLRGGRDRSAGARCRRAGRGRLRAAARRHHPGGRDPAPMRRASGTTARTGNIGVTIAFGDKAATDAAFATAAHVVSLRLENNRITANAIEPRCVVGAYGADGRYTLYTTSQNPQALRTALATSVFNVPETKHSRDLARRRRRLRHEVQHLSRRRARAVGVAPRRPAGQMDRDPHREPAVRHPCARPGRLRRAGARRRRARSSRSGRAPIRRSAPTGGPPSRRPCSSRMMLIPSVYDVQTVDLSTNAVFTNTAPTSVYRGAGRPEAIYLIERLLDQAARVPDIDRVEIRRRNLIKPSALPYHTPTHHNYDSGEFERMMDQCLTLADWKGFEARRERERRGRQAARALGHALYRARRRVQRPHGAALRSERHGIDHRRHAFARPGTRDRVRAARRPNGSACRSRPSATSRAIPPRWRSAAARSRRAAPWSAASRCASPPTPSSPRAKDMAGASCWRRTRTTSSSRTAGSPSPAPTRRSRSPRWRRPSSRRPDRC